MQEGSFKSIIEDNVGWIVEIQSKQLLLKVLCHKFNGKIYYGNIDALEYHLEGKEVRKITKTWVVFN